MVALRIGPAILQPKVADGAALIRPTLATLAGTFLHGETPSNHLSTGIKYTNGNDDPKVYNLEYRKNYR